MMRVTLRRSRYRRVMLSEAVADGRAIGRHTSDLRLYRGAGGA